jgi:hypothetical protein
MQFSELASFYLNIILLANEILLLDALRKTDYAFWVYVLQP